MNLFAGGLIDEQTHKAAHPFSATGTVALQEKSNTGLITPESYFYSHSHTMRKPTSLLA